jgi:polar amino acid transport system substrate-binding protein
MRKTILRLTFVALFVVLTAVCAVAGPALDRIMERGALIVGTTGQQPPMSATAKDGELIGLDVDIASALAKGLGVEIQFATMPFAELLPALEAGKIDMILSGMTITPARNKKIAFVGPYYVSGKGILAIATRYSELQDANGLNAPEVTVATLKNSTSATFAQNLMPKANLIPTASYDEAVSLLLQKKADVMVADLPFCALAAYRHQDKGLSAGKSPLTFEPLGIAMPEDTLLINWVENFMTTFQGTGALAKLHEKWLQGGSWINRLP